MTDQTISVPFDHLAKGNTLMKGLYPFDFKKMDKLFDQITHSYENNSIPPLAINEGQLHAQFLL